MAVACPLEGLVRSVASPQETTADLGFRSNTCPASATSFSTSHPFVSRNSLIALHNQAIHLNLANIHGAANPIGERVISGR